MSISAVFDSVAGSPVGRYTAIMSHLAYVAAGLLIERYGPEAQNVMLGKIASLLDAEDQEMREAFASLLPADRNPA
jgi:hypothetical protein